MSAAKHTPGPWRTYVNTMADVVVRKTFADGQESHEIARVKSGLTDARLIAAAPELLDAAQAAWNCIAELSPTQARVEVAQMLQAAIAKATGSAA